MLDAFKQLVESGVMTEDTKSVVEAAFIAKIQENRDQVTAQLREEFAQKYSHDKTVMVEAIDKMLSERLAAEMAEFAEDKKALAEAKVNYQQKMKGDAKVLESFIMNQLGKELVEFQSDRKKVSENFAKLEKFVVHALAKEINEFAQDKKDLAETKVKLVREAKVRFDDIKSQFIKRSAKVVESAISKQLTSEMKQLKEDIDSARSNDFGRRLFEAFANEYSNSYLNEKSETSKLLKIIEKKDLEISETKAALEKNTLIVESKDREIRVAKDLAVRKTIMSEMLAPLGADKRELMQSLLEGVQTSKLATAFDKYLPAVMEGDKKKVVKATLTESTAVTGDREVKAQPQVGLDNILDIRKLAGLK
jgi:adenosyl cobinamide kinase/adenosyl cobinamide phosphate guanylyltransferase